MNADKKIINAIACEFAKHTNITKAVIFGSRARGDNSERSDYDIAVYGAINSQDQAHIRYTFDEEIPTLHKIDLLFYNDCTNDKLKRNIDTEGIIIYGKA